MSEQSPAFQLYPRDLLADTDNLTDAAFGLYVRLLCKQWLNGSLPAEFESDEVESMIDVLPIGDLKERRRSWKAISKHFKPHPTEQGRVAQSRLERIRDEQREYRERQSINGRKGVDRRRELGQLPQPNGQPPLLPSVEPSHDALVHPVDEQRSTPASAPAPATAKNDGSANGAARKKRELWVAPPLPDRMPARLPDEIDALKRVAITFARTFGNAHDDKALSKHGPAYVGALATFRSRGVAVATVWQCFCDARLSQDGRPLFGASSKKALAFLPAGLSRPAISAPAGRERSTLT